MTMNRRWGRNNYDLISGMIVTNERSRVGEEGGGGYMFAAKAIGGCRRAEISGIETKG
jgi:hypothetical protein